MILEALNHFTMLRTFFVFAFPLPLRAVWARSGFSVYLARLAAIPLSKPWLPRCEFYGLVNSGLPDLRRIILKIQTPDVKLVPNTLLRLDPDS